MAAGVKFENNSLEVKAALDQSIRNFLDEAAGEVVSATQRNSRVDTGQTKGSYDYEILDNNVGIEARIVSSLENAIWEEFGTGEYALQGGGRQGGWKYKDAKGDWHFTRGKSPNRPFFNAYTALKGK